MSVLRETQRAEFAAQFSVSRETLAKLDRYAALLDEWQGRMNLVGPATLPDVWTRHFADSAQLFPLAPPGPWLDIGAGAGFPGLVAAIIGAGPIHLVESTAKKVKFLEAVAAELALGQVTVHNARVESLPAFAVATISARACAALGQLFDWGLRFARADTVWLLPKGASAEDEIGAAQRTHAFHVKRVSSVTDVRSTIVVASGVRRR